MTVASPSSPKGPDRCANRKFFIITYRGDMQTLRANVTCPAFVKTPLVGKQIPEQAKTLGVSAEDVVNKIMLGGTVDKQFTTVEDVAEIAYVFAAFPTNALTGQSMIVSHGGFMEQTECVGSGIVDWAGRFRFDSRLEH